MGRVILVLGGARSGKSAYAEGRACEVTGTPTYIATGRVWDDEMRERVEAHRESRGERWKTVEAPEDLENALGGEARDGHAVLVDCLTLWLTNLMMADAPVDERADAFAASLPNMDGTTVLVSNEVGLGVVPDNAMARRFRDHAGRLHQKIAAVADEVVLVVAGLPMTLKGP